MQIELGQHIRSSDGHDIGKIKHLLLNPANGQLKTLVVEKGFFLPDDIEIPLDSVEEKGGQGVYVRYTAEQMKTLPRFDESLYTPLPPEKVNSFLGFPYGSALWPIGYPLAPISVNAYPLTIPENGEKTLTPPSEVQEHIQRQAEENAVLSAGDAVLSKEGEKVGEVHRVAFDSATGKPTGLVIRKGWLFPEDKEVSADAIASISEGAVTLNLNKTELQNKNQEERYAVEWSRDNKPVPR